MLAQGLLAGALPLVSVLGYELALWAALVASVAGIDLGGAYVRYRQRDAAPRMRRPARAALRLTIDAVLLTWAPLLAWAAISAVRGLWAPTCDWGFGLLCFAALPLASGALAAATGVAISLVVGPRPVLGTLLPLALIGALVAAGLARFFGAPPVFSYSPLVGYFPGNLYDERIELTSALAWARLETALWVFALLAAVASRLDATSLRWRLRLASDAAPRRRLRCAAAATAATMGAALLHQRAGALGYAVDAADLQRALRGRWETEHFVIHYDDRASIARELPLLAEDHELRLAQVTEALGVSPTRKIHSYYFADSEQKARWMGARDVEMAKPWRREIYLEHRDFPHPSLRHEIAHVVAAEFGDRWFQVSAREVLGLPLLINPGLIEGLAVAADWPGSYDRELTPDQSVRAMQELGLSPSIHELLSLAFLSLSSARSYTTAGSFMHFLLRRHGAPALRALYRSGGDFSAAYGVSADELQAQWRAELATIELTEEQIEATRERFRQVGVFSRPCPHAVADRRARAYAAVSRGELARGVDLLRKVCRDSPDEPSFRLELGDLLVRGDERQRQEAAELWRKLDDSERVTSSLRAAALERLAGEAARRGDEAAALAFVRSALRLSIGDGQRRQLLAKQVALEHRGAAGPSLRSYFFPPPAAPGTPRQWAEAAVAAEPALGFAVYLRALRRAEDGSWTQTADDLEGSLRLGLPGPSFVRNAARRLAVAGYRTGDARRVRAAAATLRSAGMTATDQLLAADWLSRLAWRERHPLRAR
jgi:hypothetical protein